MKRQTTIFLLIAAMVITVLPGMALAHGHSSRTSCVASAVSYPLCDFEDCSIAEAHMHGSVCYAGHSVGDGHEHHQVCPVRDCTLTTNHEHDGVTCFPHNAADGHGYHSNGHSGKGRHH